VKIATGCTATIGNCNSSMRAAVWVASDVGSVSRFSY